LPPEEIFFQGPSSDQPLDPVFHPGDGLLETLEWYQDFDAVPLPRNPGGITKERKGQIVSETRSFSLCPGSIRLLVTK
jgi:hypothetical protein